jgi:hypothetical protein
MLPIAKPWRAAQHHLVDPTSRKLVEQLLAALVVWTKRLGKGG